MSSKDEKFISLSLCLTGSGIRSISNSVLTAVTSVGLKRLQHAADHKLPPGAEVENKYSFTGTVWYGFVVARCQFHLHLM